MSSWMPPTPKGRVNNRVISRVVVVAIGVTKEGNREILGLSIGDSEDKVFWTEFLQSLKVRGFVGSSEMSGG